MRCLTFKVPISLLGPVLIVVRVHPAKLEYDLVMMILSVDPKADSHKFPCRYLIKPRAIQSRQ